MKLRFSKQFSVGIVIIAAGELAAVHAVQASGDALGKFRNTYYDIISEESFSGPSEAPVFDMSGGTLTLVSASFKKSLDMEGSGKLDDGRVLNFIGRVNGDIRYKFTEHAFGMGVGNCELIPFHTIAVDPARIPLGSVVRIDETVGMILPDGSTHDGLWRAEDIGSAIQGARIDLFVGAGNQGWVLDKAGIGNMQPLTVHLMTPAPDHNCTQDPPT